MNKKVVFGLVITLVVCFLFITFSVKCSSPPRNLKATAGQNRVTLEWDPPSGVTPRTYNVYQNGRLIEFENKGTTFSHSDWLLSNTSYSYYVKAHYPLLKKESSPSNIVKVTTLTIAEPPRNLKIRELPFSRELELRWEAPENTKPDSYKIYRSTEKKVTSKNGRLYSIHYNEEQHFATVNKLSYTFKSDTVSYSSLYKVTAYYNSMGESESSNSVSMKIGW